MGCILIIRVNILCTGLSYRGAILHALATLQHKNIVPIVLKFLNVYLTNHACFTCEILYVYTNVVVGLNLCQRLLAVYLSSFGGFVPTLILLGLQNFTYINRYIITSSVWGVVPTCVGCICLQIYLLATQGWWCGDSYTCLPGQSLWKLPIILIFPKSMRIFVFSYAIAQRLGLDPAFVATSRVWKVMK